MFKTLKTGLVAAVAVCCATFAAHAQEVSIKNADGLTLGASLELADGKTVADGVVLLTHGTLAHNKMEIIVNLQKLLAERGVSSLAPTLSLGLDSRTGMYDCKVPATHKHSDAMVEIGLWLNWLKGQGATNVVLAGHSRGGNQTAWFAARENDPAVSKVVLIAPATWNAKGMAISFEKSHKQPLAKVYGEAEAMVAAGKGAEFMKGVGVLYCPGADVTADSIVDYYVNDDRRHTPNLLPMINVPVLVIAGTKDTVVAGLIDAVEPLADGEKIQLAVIDGADHFFLDFYAEDAADRIAEFIQ
ncbi:alpha/beta hydrolase [Magnetovibrio sp.]|uniref:alpha/beta hydrolase n=1 Tax=Magnetovibrio sp. TaxID=2024836 RepID=UPI002F92E361